MWKQSRIDIEDQNKLRWAVVIDVKAIRIYTADIMMKRRIVWSAIMTELEAIKTDVEVQDKLLGN